MLVTTPLARSTKHFWRYARLAQRLNRRWGRVDDHVLDELTDIIIEAPSTELACAATEILGRCAPIEVGAVQ